MKTLTLCVLKIAVFAGKYFKTHDEQAWMCSICQLCMPMTSDNPDLRYCFAMKHVRGTVIEKLFELH